MATIPQKLPEAYQYLAWATDYLHRFMMQPDKARLDALNEMLRQYQQAVQAGHVVAPRIFI